MNKKHQKLKVNNLYKILHINDIQTIAKPEHKIKVKYISDMKLQKLSITYIFPGYYFTLY
jgi:hypothetical protein